MIHNRLLRPRWLVYLIVAWGVVLAAAPHPGDAAPLPPASDPAVSGDPEAVPGALEQKLIRERLLALGISPAEAAAVLARLSPGEQAELAARADELAAGGSTVEFIAFGIIVAMLVILILELMGRRVISRP